METLDGRPLRIAVQNDGRLTPGSLELLHGIGLEFEDHERRLFCRCRNLDLELLFIRDDDIPEYVQDGVSDLGIVGRNVVRESDARVEELRELGFAYCTLALAVPRDSEAEEAGDLEGARIATTHPHALRVWLDAEGVEADVVPIRGAAEIAPSLDVAEAVCDLVSTGTTLRMNDLRPIEELWESQAVLISSPDAAHDVDRAALIDRLSVRIEGLLTARHMKYVTLNAPVEALPRIERILPGMKSPTVLPLAEEGMVALHAAVTEEVFWEAMEKIKRAGGSEILVLPVEKVML